MGAEIVPVFVLDQTDIPHIQLRLPLGGLALEHRIYLIRIGGESG